MSDQAPTPVTPRMVQSAPPEDASQATAQVAQTADPLPPSEAPTPPPEVSPLPPSAAPTPAPDPVTINDTIAGQGV
jgi:hypothetical protein